MVVKQSNTRYHKRKSPETQQFQGFGGEDGI